MREVAIVGPPDGVAELLAVVREQRRTDLVLAVGDGDLDGAAARAVPLLRDRPAIDGAATAVRLRAIRLRAARPGSGPAARLARLRSQKLSHLVALWRREWRSCARTPIARGSSRAWPGGHGAARHRAIDGSLLMVDVSGFTKLSERLAARGPIGAEELTEIVGTVFGGMLDDLRSWDGDVLTFGGDALLTSSSAVNGTKHGRPRQRCGSRPGTRPFATSGRTRGACRCGSAPG